MTNLVFATWGGRMSRADLPTYTRRSYELGIKRLLATIVYPPEVEQCEYYASLHPGEFDLWLDSGAFSVWKSGGNKTVFQYEDELRRYLPRLAKVFRQVFVISLDQIPGKYGIRPTPQEIIDASQASLENAQYLLMRGIPVIPVHHQGEPISIMEEYLKMVSYTGISPANDRHMSLRVKYAKQVWAVFKQRYPLDQMYPTHSFGNVAFELLKTFPFYSADAQTWSQGVSFGKTLKPTAIGGVREITNHAISANAKMNRMGAVLEGAKTVMAYQKTVSHLWEHRGVSWVEPQGYTKGC